MGIKLTAASGGSVELVPTNTASNYTVTVPAATGAVIVSTSGTNILSEAQGGTGSTTGVYGFKNKLINGNFDFFQRGTTNTITTSGMTVADRWQYITDGTLGTGTVFTRQTFTLGQTEVPNNPTYFLQLACTSVNTPTNYIRQRIEKVSTLQGQTATASFWLRTTSGTAACSAQFQQEFGSGGSPSSGVYAIGNTSFTITTTWTKYTITAAIPSIAGKTLGTDNNDALNIGIYFPVGGVSGTYQVAQCQVELGAQATSFDLRPLPTELAMCQRYYGKGRAYGIPRSNDNVFLSYTTFKVDMRAAPTITTSDSSPVQYTEVDAWAGYKSPGVAGSVQIFYWTATAEL